MKVAVIIRNFVTTGGAERYAVEVTRRLARDHEVHVFAQTWDEQLCEGLLLHRVPKLVNKPSFLNQLLFSRAVNRLVDDSFDIIHTHERVSRFDVLTIHCPCFRGFITEKEKWFDKLKVWLSVSVSPRCWAYLWMEKRQFGISGRNKVFIAVSDNVQHDVQRNYSVPDSYFVKAYPGVEVLDPDDPTLRNQALACEEALGFTAADTVLLFVGTEFKRKGLDFLLSGLSLVEDPGVKLVVVGGGDTRHYKEKAAELGLADRVLFTGLVTNVFAYYLLADIFILPTLSDPCPMSPVEAMYFGLPVIMSETEYCGTAEHVRHDEALLLDDPRQPELIGRAITKMLDPAFRRTVAGKGQEIARQLTWDNAMEKTLQAYRLCRKQ